MKISVEPEYRNIALGNKSATGYKSGSNLVQCKRTISLINLGRLLFYLLLVSLKLIKHS